VVFWELSELDEDPAGGIARFELGEPSGAMWSVIEHATIRCIDCSPR
jgi:hypothetical protein